MIELTIPGFGELRLQHLVLDYNGTLACDGRLLDGVEDLLGRIDGMLHIHIITADTFGSAGKMFGGTAFTTVVLPAGGEDEAKANYVRNLAADSVVCIGNGRNDRLMLAEAAFGIAVMQREGVAAAAMSAADIIVVDIRDGLGLLLHPQRMVATLRC